MALAPVPQSLPQPQNRLRLSSPEQVLAAVPYLLGFTPSRSLVVLSLRGKQVGLTMRLDLDTPPAELREVVVNRLHADRATTAILIVFDPDDSGGSQGRPGSRVARPLIRALRRERLAVKDAMGVRDGRFWSYLCNEPSCCPPGGRTMPVAGQRDHTLVASTFVAMGTAPLASREELSASVEAGSLQRRAELDPAFERAVAAPAAYPLQRWREAVLRYTEAPPRRALPDTEIAHLIVSLGDVAVRDEIVSWTAGAEITGVLAVLRELAPCAPPPYDVQVLASLAWTALSMGEGALAAVALERAHCLDPQHGLANLLGAALESGVTPEQLRAISSELSQVSELSAAVSLPEVPDDFPSSDEH
ncbi:MAG TPA: DUF4192 domain-containing protein [Frankiaceae bacterium]|jgi:hypothetical protein|nr:DUF4192 domain-containing protein [Frankiaceae bacterium]